MEVPPFNVESDHVMSQCQGCVDKKWLDLYYASLKTNISEYIFYLAYLILNSDIIRVEKFGAAKLPGHGLMQPDLRSCEPPMLLLKWWPALVLQLQHKEASR